MDPHDQCGFFQALNALSEVFCDEMSEIRQETYWRVFGARSTLAEWQEACYLAIERERFHKVPLPAVLWAYIEERRAREQAARDAERARLAEATAEAQRLAAVAERHALEASPAWQAEQARRIADHHQKQQEWEAFKAQQPRAWHIAMGYLNPADPSRWRTLTADDLAYTPTVDAAVAKARLREQLHQLMSDRNEDAV